MDNLKQEEKIIARMISLKGQQEWFNAVDFQKLDMPSDLFVGYEASARMSDVFNSYPCMFDRRTVERYRELRFRFEDLPRIMQTVGPAMADFIDRVFFHYKISKDRPEKLTKKVEKNDKQQRLI